MLVTLKTLTEKEKNNISKYRSSSLYKLWTFTFHTTLIKYADIVIVNYYSAVTEWVLSQLCFLFSFLSNSSQAEHRIMSRDLTVYHAYRQTDRQTERRKKRKKQIFPRSIDRTAKLCRVPAFCAMRIRLLEDSGPHKI